MTEIYSKNLPCILGGTLLVGGASLAAMRTVRWTRAALNLPQQLLASGFVSVATTAVAYAALKSSESDGDQNIDNTNNSINNNQNVDDTSHSTHVNGTEKVFDVGAVEAVQMKDRYDAAMQCAMVGDVLGFRWEFKGWDVINPAIARAGGVDKIDISGWGASDDTMMTCLFGEALIDPSVPLDGKTEEFIEALTPLAADNFLFCWKDDAPRAYGITTKNKLRDLAARLQEHKFPSSQSAAAKAVAKPAAERQDRLAELRQAITKIPYDPNGGGCGGAMRTTVVGLALYGPKNREKLIAAAVETTRLTHNHPTGILGGIASALFVAFAMEGIPIAEWGVELFACKDQVESYIDKAPSFTTDKWRFKKNQSYFWNTWKKYLAQRNLLGDDQPTLEQADFESTGGLSPAALHDYWKPMSWQGWAGASGHDAPLIAYDAFLAAHHALGKMPANQKERAQLWKELCLRAILHPGDNDSTGIIAGAMYGALYGMDGVPRCHLTGEPALAQRMYRVSKGLLARSNNT